jgi:hypothetical protein
VLAVALGLVLFTMAFAADHAGWIDVLFLLAFFGLGVLFIRSWEKWLRQIREQAREEGRRERSRSRPGSDPVPDDAPLPKQLYVIGAVIVLMLAAIMAMAVAWSRKPHPLELIRPTTPTAALKASKRM